MKSLLTEVAADGTATLTLNRAEVHNAFDDTLIAELGEALDALQADAEVRVVVLAAKGRSFSAGADLNWMQRMAQYSHADNVADATAAGELMYKLSRLAKPTLALVQGPAYGGGVGLVACCDIAVAADTAVFCLSEVRLGLIPAVISPYVVEAMGVRSARRYFQTAERFDAHAALRLGLVHEVVPPAELSQARERIVGALAQAGPQALAAAKELIEAVKHRRVDAALVKDTAARIAARRASTEGREGVAAFLQKRAPSWRRTPR